MIRVLSYVDPLALPPRDISARGGPARCPCSAVVLGLKAMYFLLAELVDRLAPPHRPIQQPPSVARCSGPGPLRERRPLTHTTDKAPLGSKTERER